MNELSVNWMVPDRSGARPVLPAIEKLTPTQMRVFEGVRLGLANKQIAFHLGIAEATVKAHMTALMRKLQVSNRTQVAILGEKLAQTDLELASLDGCQLLN